MTAVFFVMCFDIAPIVIWIFELPLDQEVRAVSVIRILLGFERGLVVVAIAEDRSGYVVGVKVHDSLNYTAGSRKPIAILVDLKPRHRGSGTTHRGGQHVAFLVVEVDRKRRRSLQSVVTRSSPSAERGGGRTVSVSMPKASYAPMGPFGRPVPKGLSLPKPVLHPTGGSALRNPRETLADTFSEIPPN